MTTTARALELNQDDQIYGTFAEIGAGQEVARHFFQAGQASHTIAKTISAYDMVYSDEIYGKEESGRYVCESRLQKMLTKEYNLLIRRLEISRGARTQFFAYANTVTTGDQTKRYCHGWMGVRFQTKIKGAANEIILHVRMLDKYRLQQQETLGILGTNLVWTAFRGCRKMEDVIPALVDSIREGQVQIDMIRCSGPDLVHLNNHLLNLELVRRRLAPACLFGPQGQIVDAGDMFFHQSILVDRGDFRPITKTHLDLVARGLEQFPKEFPQAKTPLVIFEMTMQSLRKNQTQIDEQDFLERVQVLSALGHPILVSNFNLFYSLKKFLRQYTREPIALLVKASNVQRLFDPSHYADLEGGVLEGLGRLFDQETRIFAFPILENGQCLLAENYVPVGRMEKLFQYFRSQNEIVNLGGCESLGEFYHSGDVEELIGKGDPAWEKLVPSAVAQIIKERKIFGVK